MRKFDVLVAFYIFGIMLAELLGAKTFQLFTIGSWHLTASVAIFALPLLFTITDVIVEVQGRKQARGLVYTGIGLVALLALFELLAVHLPPSARFAGREAAYDTIFGASIRLALASLAAFAISELLDVFVFARLHEALRGRALWLRNNLSNVVSQLADSTIFLTLAFYAVGVSFGGNVAHLTGLIVPYWLIKCSFSALQTPLAYLGVWWLQGEAKKSAAAGAAA